MYIIHDKKNGILINHSSSWCEDARVAWYNVDEYRESGPTPMSLRECQCDAKGLIAGRFTLISGTEPPIYVIARAVALAVEDYLRSKLTKLLDNDLFIEREKL